MQNGFTFHEKTALGFLKNARAAQTQDGADWHMRQAVRHADKAGLSLEAIEAKAALMEAAKAPAKARCPHYATIQAFFKAAKENGLDTVTESGKDRCRGALSVYLGKRIQSRAELTANDWENGITGVKAGVLFW